MIAKCNTVILVTFTKGYTLVIIRCEITIQTIYVYLNVVFVLLTAASATASTASAVFSTMEQTKPSQFHRPTN